MRISDWSSDVCSSDLEAGTAYLIRQYPTMTSSQGLVTAEAIAFLLWITVPVFVLVVLLIVYSMIRFRVADDDEEPSAAQYRSRSEEHKSELQSLMRISYAVFCL